MANIGKQSTLPSHQDDAHEGNAEASFHFDTPHPQLVCRKPDCGQMTNCWDGKTVICPACGPYSLVRYW